MSKLCHLPCTNIRYSKRFTQILFVWMAFTFTNLLYILYIVFISLAVSVHVCLLVFSHIKETCCNLGRQALTSLSLLIIYLQYHVYMYIQVYSASYLFNLIVIVFFFFCNILSFGCWDNKGVQTDPILLQFNRC